MDAIRAGATPEEVYDATGIDPWFVDQLCLINEVAREILQAPSSRRSCCGGPSGTASPTSSSASLRNLPEDVVRGVRHALGIRPVYKTVDTCAAEFAARTPYHYSSYDEETEVAPRERPAVIILGSGPNRIGQGIEFDYSCVHASLALAPRRAVRATRRSWSTATPRRSRPTTTPPTGSTSSRSPSRTCSRSCTPSRRPARSPA